MILYHCNLGFPLLDEHAELLTPARQVLARDEVARPGLGHYNRFELPQPGYAEQVFFHELGAAADGFVTVALVNHWANAGRGLGIYIRYRQRELPRFTEWKMMGFGDYVLGMEPGNCWPNGRADERSRGTLVFLEPGETREYVLEIGVLSGEEQLSAISGQLSA